MAECSPSLGLPSRREEHNADRDAAKDHQDGCRDAWGLEEAIRDQRQSVACQSETAAWDAWDGVRPDASAFRQSADRDVDAEKLAALARAALERVAQHLGFRRQTDRAQDAARSTAPDG